MPIVRVRNSSLGSEFDYGLVKVEDKGDKRIFTHAQNVEPIMAMSHDIRKNDRNNGFSDDHEFRRIGLIPLSIVQEHPEWMKDPGLIRKWLRTEEGAPYRTVNKGI